MTPSGSARPVLSLVVDRSLARHPLPAAVEAAVRGGVDRVQIRDRALEGRALLAWAREIAVAAKLGAASRGGGVSIIVNRRVDIALAIKADGVHLGFDALAPTDARVLLAGLGNATAAIGVSLHAPGEIERARKNGATYVHLAPIWEPKSKPATRPALGGAQLAAAVAAAPGMPVLAQGGVTAKRCRDVAKSGAAGVAVTGEILLAADPAEAARRMRAALDSTV